MKNSLKARLKRLSKLPRKKKFFFLVLLLTTLIVITVTVDTLIANSFFAINLPAYPSYSKQIDLTYTSQDNSKLNQSFDLTSLSTLPSNYDSVNTSFPLTSDNNVELLNSSETAVSYSGTDLYTKLVKNNIPIVINDDLVLNSVINISKSEKAKFYSEKVYDQFHTFISRLMLYESFKKTFLIFDRNQAEAIAGNLKMLNDLNSKLNDNSQAKAFALESSWDEFNSYFSDVKVPLQSKVNLSQSILNLNYVNDVNNYYSIFNFFVTKSADNNFKKFYSSIYNLRDHSKDLRNLKPEDIAPDTKVLGIEDSKKTFDTLSSLIGSQVNLTKDIPDSPVYNFNTTFDWAVNPLVVSKNIRNISTAVLGHLELVQDNPTAVVPVVPPDLTNYSNFLSAVTPDLASRLLFLLSYQSQLFKAYGYNSEQTDLAIQNITALNTLSETEKNLSADDKVKMAGIFSFFFTNSTQSKDKFLTFKSANLDSGIILAASITNQTQSSDDYSQIISANFKPNLNNLTFDPVTNLYQQQNTVRIPVLMYHQITNVPSDPSKEYYVSPEVFDAQMAYLVKNNYHALSIDEFWADLQAQKNPPDKAILITFDDGLANQYTNAYPILKKYNLKATFFIIANHLGINTTQLKEMSDFGMSIEDHSSNHKNLAKLSDSGQLYYEIASSKSTLESITGKPVIAIAYPYCAANGNAVSYVINAGYNLGFTCGGTIDSSYYSRYYLPRVQILNSLDSFKDRINGKLTKPAGYNGDY